MASVVIAEPPTPPQDDAWLKAALGPDWTLTGKYPSFIATAGKLRLGIDFTPQFAGAYGSNEFQAFLQKNLKVVTHCGIVYSDRRQPFFFDNQAVLSAFFHAACPQKKYVSGLFIPKAQGLTGGLVLWVSHGDKQPDSGTLEWHRYLRRIRIEP